MTTTPTSHEPHERLAQVLACSTVPRLTYAVHTRNARTIHALLTDLTTQELYGLAVVLASRIGSPLQRPDDGVIDHIAIERACAGHPEPLTTTERHTAAHKLTSRGVAPTAIASLLHVSETTIKRLLQTPIPLLNTPQEPP